MGKIKSFFQKTGVALAALAISVLGVFKFGPALDSPGILTEALTAAGGLVCAGAVMIGCGIGKAVQSSKEKKLLKQMNGPELEGPKQAEGNQKQTVNNDQSQTASNGYTNGNQSNNGNFGQKVSQAAEKIGQSIEKGANNLGIDLGNIFGNNNRPNNSANPYSSTVNTGSNPYSSTDRMSAGRGGTYNGRQYGGSYSGDVRDARQMGNTGGYYSGGGQSYSYSNNGRNGQNGYNGGRQGRSGQNGYNGGNQDRNGQNGYNGYQNRNNQNSYNSNQNVQYGGGPNNRPSNNQGQNVQYGNYQNGGSSNYNNQNRNNNSNISGLDESAQSNYFENEPGSSTYRSGPLKKEKL